jgi:hypothetical protein
VEKYNGQECTCGQNRTIDPRCEYDGPVYRQERWKHRHEGVDSMRVAMMYVPWQHWISLLSGGRPSVRNHFSGT